MAFWEVHAPLGGLSLPAASRGNQGWGEGLAEAVGGLWQRWRAPPPRPRGHVKVAFCRETPEGGDRGGEGGAAAEGG